MREIDNLTKHRRGCAYCLDFQKRRSFNGVKKVCIHDECPYHELDGYRSYRVYLKLNAPTIRLDKLLKK